VFAFIYNLSTIVFMEYYLPTAPIGPTVRASCKWALRWGSSLATCRLQPGSSSTLSRSRLNNRSL
jgi:hypothetical protein